MTYFYLRLLPTIKTVIPPIIAKTQKPASMIKILRMEVDDCFGPVIATTLLLLIDDSAVRTGSEEAKLSFESISFAFFQSQRNPWQPRSENEKHKF